MDLFTDLLSKLNTLIKKIFGFSRIRSGNNVDLDGTGEPFESGSNVDQTTHSINNSEYKKEFETKRPDSLD